jgi:hypothetical protein
VTWGLQLPRWKVNVFLFLFDGSPLSEDEFRRYLSSYAAPGGNDSPGQGEVETEKLRALVLEAMRELLRDLWPNSGPASIKALIVSEHLDSQPIRRQTALDLDSEPGMRLSVRARPSRITTPGADTFEDWIGLAPHVQPLGVPDLDALSQEAFEFHHQRREIGLKSLADYGQVSIHAKPAIQRMLTETNQTQSARRHIERLTQLLWEYDAYHVGLADQTPALELKITAFDWAEMLGAGSSFLSWGNWPISVYWNDPKAVLMFVNGFWENFYNLDRKDRDKASVIAQLCEMADLPHPRTRRKS